MERYSKTDVHRLRRNRIKLKSKLPNVPPIVYQRSLGDLMAAVHLQISGGGNASTKERVIDSTDGPLKKCVDYTLLF